MQSISSEKLEIEIPSASCANCGKEPYEARGTWVKFSGHIYCPRCARYEGLY